MFTSLIPAFMEELDIHGGAITIGEEGRLVLAEGFGLGNFGNGEPMKPDSLFRNASISKPDTAVAVLELVEDDQLDLHERVGPN